MLQIEETLAQKILDYLATKPYVEVFQFIGPLQQIKPVVSPAPISEAPKE